MVNEDKYLIGKKKGVVSKLNEVAILVGLMGVGGTPLFAFPGQYTMRMVWLRLLGEDIGDQNGIVTMTENPIRVAEARQAAANQPEYIRVLGSAAVGFSPLDLVPFLIRATDTNAAVFQKLGKLLKHITRGAPHFRSFKLERERAAVVANKSTTPISANHVYFSILSLVARVVLFFLDEGQGPAPAAAETLIVPQVVLDAVTAAGNVVAMYEDSLLQRQTALARAEAIELRIYRAAVVVARNNRVASLRTASTATANAIKFADAQKNLDLSVAHDSAARDEAKSRFSATRAASKTARKDSVALVQSAYETILLEHQASYEAALIPFKASLARLECSISIWAAIKAAKM